MVCGVKRTPATVLAALLILAMASVRAVSAVPTGASDPGPTLVGAIQEDSRFTSPFTGYGSDGQDCYADQKVCHGGAGRVLQIEGRSVWRIPRAGFVSRHGWRGPYLTVSTPPAPGSPASEQMACWVMADRTDPGKARVHLAVLARSAVDAPLSTLAQTVIRVGRSELAPSCVRFQLTDPWVELSFDVFVRNNGPVLVDEVMIYQGGPEPSPIDEFAAHPFDTGTS